ncbi:MAG: DUF1127 domain-containing protein [Halocynthiibacter sp.]
MATTVNTRTMAVSPLLGLVKLSHAITDSITSWNDARITRNALLQLTDRELEDIGLTRGRIDDVVAHRSL